MGADKPTVLVVDDDPVTQRLLMAQLRTHGYNVVVAGDAIAATAAARRDAPDLVLLDLGLPGGGGFVVLSRLRGLAQTAATPVIVVSGADPKVNEQKALDAGAEAFLSKPVDMSKLLATVAKVLGRE
jgi:two-component system KDP operon response regulator KdpE